MATSRPFWNDGGPLIVVPQGAISEWEGSDPPSGGRVITARFRWNNPEDEATDYDRACDLAATGASMLPAGESWALVLGAAQSAQWLEGDDRGEFYAVGIEVADDTASDHLRAVARALGEPWSLLDPAALVNSGGLLLAHGASRLTEVEVQSAFVGESEAAMAGAIIGDALSYPAPSGRYRIDWRDVKTPDGDYLTFIRFKLNTPAA